MKSRHFLFPLVLALLLPLGCGEDEDNSGTENNQTEGETTPTADSPTVAG